MRYKLKLEVGNGTESLQLVLFDLECYAILNKSCHDMLSKNKTASLSEYPAEMENVVGKEILFRLEQKEDTSFTFEESYRVRRLCADPYIIAEYKSGMEFDTPMKAIYSSMFSSSPFLHQDWGWR